MLQSATDVPNVFNGLQGLTANPCDTTATNTKRYGTPRRTETNAHKN
jgi:hypothetical protein